MGKFQWSLCTEQLFLRKGEGASDSGEPGRHVTSAGTNRSHMYLRGSSTQKLEPFHVPTEDRKLNLSISGKGELISKSPTTYKRAQD